MGEDHYVCAGRLFEQALALHREIFGEQHQQVAVDLNELAALRKDQDQLTEAEGLFRAALQRFDDLVAEKNRSEENLLKIKYLYRYRADVLTNLAHTLKLQEKYAEAEPFYRQAMQAYVELNNQERERQARHAEDLRRREKAAERAEALLPYSQAEAVASSLFNLGDLKRYEKKYAEAEAYLRQALGKHDLLRRARFPGSARAYALDLYSLGICQRKLGRFIAARNSLESALSQQQLSPAYDALVLYHLALNALADGQPTAAQAYYRRAHAIEALNKEDFDEADQAQLESLNAVQH